MPRPPRTDIADIIYHVINRANARSEIFKTENDYKQFEQTLSEAQERVAMRIIAYCVMPNHWHLLLQPRKDGDLTMFMRLLTMTHTQRWHVSHGTVGTGHLYQGRYKSFPVQTDEYILTVRRYIERNPLRAHLVLKAEDWRWGSLWRREKGGKEIQLLLNDGPTEIPYNYSTWVNEPESDEALIKIRTSVNKGQPFGSASWAERVANDWNLQSTFRSGGRPTNKENGS